MKKRYQIQTDKRKIPEYAPEMKERRGHGGSHEKCFHLELKEAEYKVISAILDNTRKERDKSYKLLQKIADTQKQCHGNGTMLHLAMYEIIEEINAILSVD